MKKKIIIIGGILILLALIYYYVTYPRPIIPPRPQILNDLVITLERTACFGTCPVYKLTIYGDGRVVYEGTDHVEVTGTQTSQITQDQVEELVDEFYRTNYFTLNDEYISKRVFLIFSVRSTCGPTTYTSITFDGYTKKVRDYQYAPQELKDLEEKIDEITNSVQWVGEP